MSDDENGGNRQLGLLFCYKLAIKETSVLLNGDDCTSSFVDILSRWFHLKLCRWGKETVSANEENVEPSRDLMKLFVVLNHPERSWALPPKDSSSKALLERGLEMHSRMIHTQKAQMLKIFLQFWEQEFSSTISNKDYQLKCDEYRKQMNIIKTNPLSNKRHVNPFLSIQNEQASRHSLPLAITSFNCSSRILTANTGTIEETKKENSPGFSLTEKELQAYATLPLSEINMNDFLEYVHSKDSDMSSTLPFNVSGLSEAQTPIAIDMMERLQQDMNGFVETKKNVLIPQLLFLTPNDINEFISNISEEKKNDRYDAALVQLNTMIERLLQLATSDAVKMDQAIAYVLKETNTITEETKDTKDTKDTKETKETTQEENGHLAKKKREQQKMYFSLQKRCRRTVETDVTSIMGSIMSQETGILLQHTNPFLSLSKCESILNVAVEAMLRASRVVQANRVASSAKGLIVQLQKLKKYHTNKNISSSKINSLGKGIHIKANSLAKALGTQRHFMNVIQKENGDTGENSENNENNETGHGSFSSYSYDPRFLTFEYIFDIVLRQRQVEIVNSFRHEATEGSGQIVQQMIMGAGKTTVVSPLLSLCLADGNTLVTQVMPTNLLEQSRNVLRKCFSSPVMPKRIFTFTFSRSIKDDSHHINQLHKKISSTCKMGDILISAPECIKSFFLKFAEQLHSLEAFDIDGLRNASNSRENEISTSLLSKMKNKSEMSDCQLPIFDLMRSGALIMDECDVLLHPLRSELNFPIGHKYPIDLSGYRWELPIFLLDAVFAGETGTLTVKYNQRNTMPQSTMTIDTVMKETNALLRKGVAQHAFMRAPHLVLLDSDFYHSDMKPVMAKWSYLWLCSHFIGKCDVHENEILEYISGVADSRRTYYREIFIEKVSKENVKLLNLASDWLNTILPHCLTKINRVSFGLLTPADLAASDPNMPYTRKVLAVPFVGKDVPSRASEFAHPDVLIGLSILAYKYSGLRKNDLQRLVTQLKHDYSRQTGPRNERPAALLFRSWLELAVKHKQQQQGVETNNTSLNVLDNETKTNSTHSTHSTHATKHGTTSTTTTTTSTASSARSLPVLPLPLFQPTDPQQLNRLFSLTRKLPQVIHYFLCNHIFPKTMNFQRLKVSACGHALGSDILFKTRLAFSGTPSNLLPLDLGTCQYEPGSEGSIVYTLTSKHVVSASIKSKWNAQSLLKDVASQTNPPANVLIDTGALITGMDNREVAEFLLVHLRSDIEGVVYLDRSDKKCILMREGGRSVGLEQCGTSPESYFTFYDQVHTTGMDIKQAPTAHAIVTVGKDMTFRDYAQGCYRMRGIGQGQTIELYIIPEVNKRIQTDLKNKSKNSLVLDVPAWLILNSMRMESLQFIQLQLQELHNGWRKQAFTSLTDEVRTSQHVESKQRSTSGLRRFIGENEEKQWLRGCVNQFREIIGFPIPDNVPEPQRFVDTINTLVKDHAQFVQKDIIELKRIELIKNKVTSTTQLQHGNGDGASSDRSTQLQATVVQEQSKEQEEEAQKQVQQVKVKQSAFARDDEDAHPWDITLLASSPNNTDANVNANTTSNTNGLATKRTSNQMKSSVFNEFRTFTTRDGITPVLFPNSLHLTDNFYRKAWVGLGDRRLKNIGIVMEWVPIGTGNEPELIELVSKRQGNTTSRASSSAGSAGGGSNGGSNGSNGSGGSGGSTVTDTIMTEDEELAAAIAASMVTDTEKEVVVVEEEKEDLTPCAPPNWKVRMGTVHQSIIQSSGKTPTEAAVVALTQIKEEMAIFQKEESRKANKLAEQQMQNLLNPSPPTAPSAPVTPLTPPTPPPMKPTSSSSSLWKEEIFEKMENIDWSLYPPIDLSTAPGTTNSTTSTNSTSETRAPHRRYFVALTLAEGETIRRLLHDHRQQPVLKYCGIALRTSEGAVLDVSPRFPKSLLMDNHETNVDIQCLRFFNSEMYFTTNQLTSLSRALHLSNVSDRLQLFEETLRLRERERNNWSDTPVAKIFTKEEDWHLMQGRSALNRLNSMLSSISQDGGTLPENDLVKLFASEKQKEARRKLTNNNDQNNTGDAKGETKNNDTTNNKKHRLKHEWTPSQHTICQSIFSRFDLNHLNCLSVEDMHRLSVSLRFKFDVQDCVEIIKLISNDQENNTITKEQFRKSIIAADNYAHLPASCALGTAELTNLDWWSCQQCQFLNAAQNDVCVMCQCDWSGVRSIPRGYWSCDGCTKLNKDNFYYCEICGLSKKSLSSTKF